jgi:hypothetical protein
MASWAELLKRAANVVIFRRLSTPVGGRVFHMSINEILTGRFYL